MIVGHADKLDIFKKLLSEDRLAHGYIFFGEPEVGKRHFALSLANLVERGEFDSPEGTLSEALVVNPVDGSVGIDQVREAKRFLSQKPVLSKFRVAIIDDAERLTNQAQNAVLKVAEEPPQSSLIILITRGIESLLPTLRSRLQQIYFSRVATREVEKLLKDEHKVSATKAKEVAKLALGRPGRAVAIMQSDTTKQALKLAEDVINKKADKRKVIEEVLGDSMLEQEFITNIMAKLSLDPRGNHFVLRDLSDRLSKMADFTTNKRLQLEFALWNL